MIGNEIRKMFLEYFQGLGHTLVQSSSLVPSNDPTLLFTNAGMNQFKDVFLGKEKREYRRATSSQKCVRAGGKHNDLEMVGRTARHLTFFEMLGNFSFGDYFKKEAIAYAWAFLTERLKLSPQRLYATIFRGDDQSFEIWNREIGMEAGRIYRMGEKDNFWAMGETGPCGPCTEIIYDQGKEFSCGRPDCQVGCECDRYVEVWNLVFMQYNRDEKGNLSPLPAPCVDTGMGLERLLAVLQKVDSVFDTDLLLPIINYLEELCGKRYRQDAQTDISMRVIADHSRATAFLIADGVFPSNEWRGYVLRRIIRRAIRHGKLLGLNQPFLYRTVNVVVDLMRSNYPELEDNRTLISNLTLNEEERFHKTLEQGTKILDETISSLKQKSRTIIPGEIAFKLYDTYGFPLDLTVDIARENGLSVDEEGFKLEMEKQAERARQVWKASYVGTEEVYMRILSECGETNFVGYDHLQAQAKVIALVKDGERVNLIKAPQKAELFLDLTPFYAEAGGQVGDVGIIRSDSCLAQVEDTKYPAYGLISHKISIIRGEISVGDVVLAGVDEEKRRATERNHTATHILQWALRQVLGDHIKQSGSLVAPDRFRFDFTHFQALSERELEKVEFLVNQMILKNDVVHKEVLPLKEALKMNAMALFGEKYGEMVRMVSVNGYSRELCGGCHVRYTGEIGSFKILSEFSVSAGVRRIEALTGLNAFLHQRENYRLLNQLAEMLKTVPSELPLRLEKLVKSLKEKDKEIANLKTKLACGGEIDEEKRRIDDFEVVVKRVDGMAISDLRNLVDTIKKRIKRGVVVVGSVDGDKVPIVVGVTADLTERLNAGKIAGEIARLAGGGGGGRADMAQAGGKDPQLLDQALHSAFSIIQKELKV